MINKVALCLFIKDENDYLQEWLNYHRSIGIYHFFIYDNNSKVPIVINDNDVTVVYWKEDIIGKQANAYYHCAKNNQEYRWIGFIDTDEFIIIDNINSFLNKYLDYNAVGIHWLCFGDSNLSSNNLRPSYKFTEYTKHSLKTNDINKHIKSFVNPKFIKNPPNDPHFFIEDTVNERFERITGPLSYHTSESIYIKHIITRTYNEYIDKIERGRGDGVQTRHNIEMFKTLNNFCNETSI